MCRTAWAEAAITAFAVEHSHALAVVICRVTMTIHSMAC